MNETLHILMIFIGGGLIGVSIKPRWWIIPAFSGALLIVGSFYI